MFAQIRQKISGNFQTQMLLLLSLTTILPVALVGGYGIMSSTKALSEIAIAKEKEDVVETSHNIQDFLARLNGDILFLRNTPPIQGIVRARIGGGLDKQGNTNYDEWCKQLSTIFASMMKSKPQYMQLRYIDENGQEMVRVDLDGTNIKVSPKSQLQNKKSSAYFTETMKLGAGSVYVSPVELNREHGVIEKPYKPVIRYGTPIFDSAGQRRGILVANIFAQQFKEFVANAETHYNNETILLVNQDGYYISHPNPDQEWGFELGKENAKLDKDYSLPIAEEILGSEQGVIQEDSGQVISYARIVTDPKQEKFLVVIAQVPKSELFGNVNSFKNATLVIGLVALSGVLPLGYWGISRSSKLVNLVKQMVNGLTSSSQEIFATLAQQESTVNEQASSVSQTTTTMDELGSASLKAADQAESSTQGARQALDLAENGTKVVQQTMVGMSTLKEQVSNIAEQIMHLSEQTGQIANISELVESLANQTNMLALNAAVEAARAGEHGKGFAVVASEIRKLADESKKSAEKISTLATEIQASMNSTVMVTDEGTKKANESIELAQGTAQTFVDVKQAVDRVFVNTQQISLSAKQQAVAVQQVLSAMNEINVGSKQTASGIVQVKVTTEKLKEAAQQLQAAV